MIDTINGARTSAIIYSIVEIAKANNLKPYDYVRYLLEEYEKKDISVRPSVRKRGSFLFALYTSQVSI